MKLLLDENLPPALSKALEGNYPGTAHVHEHDFGSASDGTIWEYARKEGFTIVTKDADYEELSMMKGFPPKVIWVRTGNCTTEYLTELFQRRAQEIAAFITSETDAILEIR